MAKVTSSQFADKLARNLKNATPDIEAGINRVTTNPMEQAATKQEKMLTNLTAAVRDGKWARGLRRTSLDDWKSKTINKGIPRISSGIDAAHDKVVAFADQLLPFEDNLKSQIDKMPDLTIDDSVNRAASWIRGMSKFKRG